MEIWDLYDENRKLVGIDHIRGEIIPDDCYHLVVHVWIKNSEGKYLISQRSKTRKMHPLMWECVGGSVLKGESSVDGALREVEEEVGLKLKEEDGKLISSEVRKFVGNERFSDILDIWLFDYDGEVDLSKSTTDEVSQIKWMTKDEVKRIYNEGQFVKTLTYFFDRNDI